MISRLRSRISRLLAPLDARSNSADAGGEFSDLESKRSIRMLTFNIQVGISTSSYRHYLTRSWQHFLPHRQRQENLEKIASLLKGYDVVALQEVDGGSLRSGFVNQVEFLANEAGFPYWFQQLNRNFGPLAKHSNGLLSRYCPFEIEEHPLPALIPGRGVIVAKYGVKDDPLVLVIMHLSLSAAAQKTQLEFVKDLIADYRHLVLMGDMNTHADKLLQHHALKDLDLVALPGVSNTFPSWRPQKDLDHILVSRTLEIKRASVLTFPVSDHLPIELEVMLPESYPVGK